MTLHQQQDGVTLNLVSSSAAPSGQGMNRYTRSDLPAVGDWTCRCLSRAVQLSCGSLVQGPATFTCDECRTGTAHRTRTNGHGTCQMATIALREGIAMQTSSGTARHPLQDMFYSPRLCCSASIEAAWLVAMTAIGHERSRITRPPCPSDK
ncbi:hypothetical protein K469DRAFT_220245 [Zopfia rhizophila CBS 207.26]|uniref:Uncharacterized protein n=1 Tax=Zopfia rhizophila CBS 207.26 TaxID=1314779 RepID=A0A6A6DX83_9PEZI|nr:hypothetical protein K469DRAFT_220245 [Zopfia rhizophila CBS 207.26]